MAKFIDIDPSEIDSNVFRMIGREWMLITAGKEGHFNTMTASWGGLGVLWNTNVSFAFIRPQRYTYEFTERESYYSLSFFGQSYRRALQLCGTESGRDGDKVARAGLSPVFNAQAPYFDEAELVFICKKIHVQDIDPAGFLDPTIPSHYKAEDYHRLYIGEIVKVLKRIS